MRRICAWCGKILGGRNSFLLPMTHGVCARCVRELCAAIPVADGSEAAADRRPEGPAEGRGEGNASSARANRRGPSLPTRSFVH